MLLCWIRTVRSMRKAFILHYKLYFERKIHLHEWTFKMFFVHLSYVNTIECWTLTSKKWFGCDHSLLLTFGVESLKGERERKKERNFASVCKFNY